MQKEGRISRRVFVEEPPVDAVDGAVGGGERPLPPLPVPPPAHRRRFFRQATIPPNEDSDDFDDGSSERHRALNVKIVDGNKLIYSPSSLSSRSAGFYVSGKRLSESSSSYFEFKIDNFGPISNRIKIGLCTKNRSKDIIHSVWTSESIRYNVGDGRLDKGFKKGFRYGPVFNVGDQVGCGIKFESATEGSVPIFFKKNGREIVTVSVPIPAEGFYPAIEMQSEGQVVQLCTDVTYFTEDDPMVVDSAEDEWILLHKIRMNNNVLEYIGPNKEHIEVGLAQAKTPIRTWNHYFEVEIVDPGARCYIAIGLTRKGYPKNRQPGWNKGSIGYHADDGKLFVESGIGLPFGPNCHKGDIMGCGVLFPRNYECQSDSEEEIERHAISNSVDLEDHITSEENSSEEEKEKSWFDPSNVQSGVFVQIYFTRNGKLVGRKSVRMPKGGFYPTVGMMSFEEKVRVDLRPLSG